MGAVGIKSQIPRFGKKVGRLLPKMRDFVYTFAPICAHLCRFCAQCLPITGKITTFAAVLLGYITQVVSRIAVGGIQNGEKTGG